MGRIDENQDVVAQIRLAIEAYDKSRLPDNVLEEDEIPGPEEDDRAQKESRSWRLGSPDRPTTAKQLEIVFAQNGISSSVHRNFDANLKQFLVKNTGCDALTADSTIKVRASSGLLTSLYSLTKT